MRKVLCIRSGPYNYVINGQNIYKSFNDVIKANANPSLKKEGKIIATSMKKNMFSDIKVVFCSPEKRSLQTAKFFVPNPLPLLELKEIRYVMEDFISEKEFFTFGKPNVQKAREGFVHAFINNNTQELYSHVFERMHHIEQLLLNSQQNVGIVGHGFYLKVFEAYIRDKKIVTKPYKLLEYFDGKQETFRFFEGYSLIIDKNKIEFSHYIKHGEDIHV